MTGERRPAPDPTAPGTIAPDAGPADPDDAKRLARRRFLRSLASDAMKTAATVVGAAGALRESSAGMASAFLGTADAAIQPVAAERRSVARALEPGFAAPSVSTRTGWCSWTSGGFPTS